MRLILLNLVNMMIGNNRKSTYSFYNIIKNKAKDERIIEISCHWTSKIRQGKRALLESMRET